MKLYFCPQTIAGDVSLRQPDMLQKKEEEIQRCLANVLRRLK
jgi:hypothetical protein